MFKKIFLSNLIVASLLVNASIITFAFDPNKDLDGKFDPLHQGAIGNCGLIAAIQALENSEYGKDLLKRMITPAENGGFKLNFGTGIIQIDQTNLLRAKSTGDFDARVIEAALQMIVDESLPFESSYAYYHFLRFTGFKEKNFTNKSGEHTKMKRILNYMQAKTSDGSGIMAACDFEMADEAKGIIGNGSHTYSIQKVTKTTVVVINPWDTSKKITLTRKWFLNAVNYITVVSEENERVYVSGVRLDERVRLYFSKYK